ncbi:hypothetical protein RIF29_20628 [Crotalaria pallida]|uniref:Uncharacterized protein n=1 Tax=Crotalaria pallida TaxID=3830 RepID=A0AAN9F1G9_CROPI
MHGDCTEYVMYWLHFTIGHATREPFLFSVFSIKKIQFFACYIVMRHEFFVDTLEYENDILGASMESWLGFAVLLTNTEPTFLKESTLIDGGREYYRYHVLLNTNIIGDHPFTIGRYAESEFFAREDAAVVMIKRLLAATNKQVFDFNYHNLTKQNEVMDGLQAQNWELTKENQRLKEEIHVLREILEVPSKGRSNQNQMDSESANLGLNGGNVTDGDEAFASVVATQSDTTPSNLLELVEV